MPPGPSLKRINCPACGGRGKVTKAIGAVENGKTKTVYRDYPCARCGGRGDIPV